MANTHPERRTCVAVEDLSIAFSEQPLTTPLTFSVLAGDVTSIIGRSGVGKTSTLRAISGLLDDYSRHQRLVVPEQRSTVFQEDRLFPWCDLISNVVAPLDLKGKVRHQDVALAMNLLENLALGGHERRMPHEVSGGTRQRVAIARALIGRPELLLLDEPFASLDFDNKIRAQRVILDQLRSTGACAIIVTHDIDDAVSLSSQIVRLKPFPAPSEVEVLDWRTPLMDPIESRKNKRHFEAVRSILADEKL